jgi:hypothetical protein
VFSLKYVVAALILMAAAGGAVSLGRLWRHRVSSGYEVGSVSQRWLSEIRREDET